MLGHLRKLLGKKILVSTSWSELKTFSFALGSDNSGALVSWLMALILTSAKESLFQMLSLLFSEHPICLYWKMCTCVHMYVFYFTYFPLGDWAKRNEMIMRHSGEVSWHSLLLKLLICNNLLFLILQEQDFLMTSTSSNSISLPLKNNNLWFSLDTTPFRRTSLISGPTHWHSWLRCLSVLPWKCLHHCHTELTALCGNAMLSCLRVPH